MKKAARNLFAMNTLYSVSAIGLGLFLFDGRVWPLFVAILAYAIGYSIAWSEDNAN